MAQELLHLKQEADRNQKKIVRLLFFFNICWNPADQMLQLLPVGSKGRAKLFMLYAVYTKTIRKILPCLLWKLCQFPPWLRGSSSLGFCIGFQHSKQESISMWILQAIIKMIFYLEKAFILSVVKLSLKFTYILDSYRISCPSKASYIHQHHSQTCSPKASVAATYTAWLKHLHEVLFKSLLTFGKFGTSASHIFLLTSRYLTSQLASSELNS